MPLYVILLQVKGSWLSFTFCLHIDIGADVLDSTGQSVVSFGQLEEEDTWFELSPRQRRHFEDAQRLSVMLRDGAHNIQQLLWRPGFEFFFEEMPTRFHTPHTDIVEIFPINHVRLPSQRSCPKPCQRRVSSSWNFTPDQSGWQFPRHCWQSAASTHEGPRSHFAHHG